MTKPQEPESQNRIDSIIALIMEEANTVKNPNARSRVYHVLMKIQARVMEIMRTMKE